MDDADNRDMKPRSRFSIFIQGLICDIFAIGFAIF